MIGFIKQKGNPEEYALELVVEQSGMTITVKAGEFRWGKVDYSFPEDVAHVVDTPSEEMSITGWLAADESGNAVVVVDEDEANDSEPYQWEGSPYKPLVQLYELRVPAGATDLDGVNLSVRRVTSYAEEE